MLFSLKSIPANSFCSPHAYVFHLPDSLYCAVNLIYMVTGRSLVVIAYIYQLCLYAVHVHAVCGAVSSMYCINGGLHR